MAHHGHIVAVVIMVLLMALPAFTTQTQDMTLFRMNAVSRGCMDCHEGFYTRWSSSRHGLSVQPYSAVYAQKRLKPQEREILIARNGYRAEIAGDSGWVQESSSRGVKTIPISQVLGGKDIYCFLTPFENGRHLILPVAYDIQAKEWFDLSKMGSVHLPDIPNKPNIGWSEKPYVFTVECYRCHVDAASTEYDLNKQAYQNAITSHGISCGSCHGPGAEHASTMKDMPHGQTPSDPKISRWNDYTTGQKNDVCTSCHATAAPLTRSFRPGERFFDHFSPATLEDPDIYPDGRGKGQGFTSHTFYLSPCFKSGRLGCDVCHTAGGGYRHNEQGKANESCMPCHEKQVRDSYGHTHHKADTSGGRCVSCHMPTTGHGWSRFTDHSMRPPAPAATIRYQSPNACNACHTDKDAPWADQAVRRWWTHDYQAAVMSRSGLMDDARKGDWTRLSEMISYVIDKKRDDYTAASLLRLMGSCTDARVQSAALKGLADSSPLVRSAAVESLGRTTSREAVRAIMDAANDECRLVRIRAAEAYVNSRLIHPSEVDAKKFDKAVREYQDSLTARPDNWVSYYRLGDYLLNSGNVDRAIEAYGAALNFEPDSVAVLVNLASAYAKTADSSGELKCLQKALMIEPGNAAANYRMGLLKARLKDSKGAQKHLRMALKADPGMADAAFNLGIIIFKSNPGESLLWLRKARDLQPEHPKYAYNLAYYSLQTGRSDEGIRVLNTLILEHPQYVNAYVLLGETLVKLGRKEQAMAVYQKGMNEEKLPQPARSYLGNRLGVLSQEKEKPRQ